MMKKKNNGYDKALMRLKNDIEISDGIPYRRKMKTQRTLSAYFKNQ